MTDYSPLLNHISSQITFSDSEQELFLSVLKTTRLKRRQFLIQPGMVSKDRSFIVRGAFRVFLIGNDGEEHTISLAIDNGWTGDPASFISQEPSPLFVQALEDSIVIQWSYESDQLLLDNIPQFSKLILRRSQQISVMIQRRVISHLSQSAEERYQDFALHFPEHLQRFPLHIIASYLGMTREFLSKIRNKR